MGTKIGLVFMGYGQLLTGFIIAFTQGPQLAGILMAFFPILLLTLVCFIAGIMSGVTEMAKQYAQSAGYAEQAL